MVLDLIWPPYFFGPREIWTPRNLGPEKFGSQEIWTPRNLGPKKFEPHIKIITWNFPEGTKFLGDQTSRGPNFSLTKFLGDQERQIGDHISYKVNSSTIIASKFTIY